MQETSTQHIELDLTLEQVLSIIRQLGPRERGIVRQATEPLPWELRLDALLARVWSRVESRPIAEDEVEAEVELGRTELYAQSRH
jgi:hypothetical protein